ncbi:ParA family protein [Priestia megaterium]|uniref:ParA family protein n=1 Tax=Priestia megaterium TaxID=1404 RepID=UPI00362D9E48
MGEIISVVSNKGGVLKTSIVANLGAVIAKENPKKKVLLIDLDTQSNLSMTYGLNPNTFDTSTYDVLTGNLGIEDVLRKTELPNLFLAPSNEDLEGLEFEVIGKEDYKPFQLLRSSVEHLRKNYDYVLIDTPPNLGLVVLNALAITDKVIIPVVPELYSYRGLQRVIKTIKGINERRSTPIEIEGVLMTKVQTARVLHSQIMPRIRQECDKANIRCLDTLIKFTGRYEDSTAFSNRPAVLEKTNKQTKHLIQPYFDLLEELNYVKTK